MTIEDSFGILTTVWRILLKSLDFKLDTSINIVKCLLCLHNFLLSTELYEPNEKKTYAAENLLKKNREKFNFNENVSFDNADDDEEEEEEDNDDNEFDADDNINDNNQETGKKKRKTKKALCSQEQKIRNKLAAYFKN